MYYIIVGGTIYETPYNEPSQDELQELADRYNEHVYVIRGEHYGMSAEPQEDVANAAPGASPEVA